MTGRWHMTGTLNAHGALCASTGRLPALCDGGQTAVRNSAVIWSNLPGCPDTQGCICAQVFPLAKKLADCVIPAEYGISPDFKLRIGHKIAKELIGKLLLDLDNVKAESFSADEDLRQRSVGTNGVVPFGGSNDVDVATGTSEGSQAHDSRGNDEIGDRRRSYSRGGGAAGGSAHTTGAADVVRGGDDDMMASTRGFSDEVQPAAQVSSCAGVLCALWRIRRLTHATHVACLKECTIGATPDTLWHVVKSRAASV